MKMALKGRVLGRFSVQVEDRPPAGPWQRPAARRLVQVLLLRPNHRITRDALAEILFPNLPPEEAARAVSKALAMARSAFGPNRDHLLAADRSSVWIDDSFEVTTDLEDLVAALRSAMTRDPGLERDQELERLLELPADLLADEPYADWATAARDSFAQVRRAARLELARGRAARNSGDRPAAVIEAWQACLADDPAEEEAAGGLMRAYLARGQRDLAIRTFHRCRAALKQELAAEPGPDLVELFQSAMAIGSRPRWDSELRQRSPGQSPSLHGRGALLARLSRLLSRVDMPSLLVTGPAGIGKTRLLDALGFELSEQGWAVLRQTASPSDLRTPLSALRRLLPELLEEAGGSVAPSIQKLLATSRDESGSAADSDPLEVRQLANDIRHLLDGASRTAPLVLLLDDAQWWDRGTQRVVAELAEPPVSGRWSLVMAARRGEPKAPVPRLPLEVPRFELQPLSERATRAVVRDIGRGRRRIPRYLAAAIADRSRGNPFFAVELARQALVEQVPDSRASNSHRVPAKIVELLEARLHRCSWAARQLLPVAALAAEEASYELLIRVGCEMASNRSPEGVVKVLDELVAADLLVEEPAGVRLMHPLLLEAALAGINPVRRGSLHSRIADALDRIGPGPRGVWAEAAARHRLLAFEFGRLRETAPAAADAGFAAGHRARELLAREAAVELFRGARSAFEVLDGTDREQLRGAAVAAAAALGDCLLDADDFGAAAEAYGWGLELAESDQERARLWSAVGGISYRHGDMAGAALAYERGIASLAQGNTVAQARLLSDLGWARQRQGRHLEALQLYEQARPSLESAGDDTNLAWLFDRQAIALVADGRPGEALQASTHAFEAGARAGMRRELAAFHVHRADVFEALGELPDALAQCHEAIRISTETGDRYMQAVAHWETADTLAALGQLGAALAERDAELCILLELDNPRNLAGNQLHRAQLLSRLHRLAEAREAAREARKEAGRADDERLLARIENGLSDLDLELVVLQAGATGPRQQQSPASGMKLSTSAGQTSGT